MRGLVSPSDISEIAGVSRGAVSNWRKRHDDFPEVVGGSPSKPLFDRNAVVSWLKQNGRDVNEMSAGHLLWSALNAVRGVLPTEQAARLLLFLAAAKRASLAPQSGINFDELATVGAGKEAGILTEWAERLRQAVPQLRLVEAPMRANTPRGAVAPLATAVDSVPATELASAVDHCLEDASRWLGRSGREFGFVGSPTAEMLASLVPAHAETVYDPACGIAAALLRLPDPAKPRQLVGHDISRDVLSEAAQRAYLHNVELELAVSNVLEFDPDPELRADVVIAEPPLGMRWNSAAALSDPRFVYGVPAKSGADLAWIQHAIAHLAPHGTAFVLTTSGALSHQGRNSEIRTRLVSAGCVEAIVQLPGKLLPTTSIAPVLWVLRPAHAVADVLLVDASEAVSLEREIANALGPDAARGENSLPSRRVSVADLLGAGANLVPSHWIDAVDIDDDDLMRRLRTASARLGRAITSVTRSAPAAPPLIGSVRSRVATVGQLVDDGVVELTRGRKENAYPDDDWTQRRIVRAGDVREERLPLRETASTDDALAARFQTTARPVPRDLDEPDTRGRVTRPGDVLVTTMHEVRVLVDDIGGHLPSTGVNRLRVTNPSVLDPVYLAAMLTGSWNERFRTGSTIQRIPVKDLEVPMLPLVEQEAAADSYGELSRIRRAAIDAAREARSLQSAILDAIRYNAPLSDLDETAAIETQESE